MIDAKDHNAIYAIPLAVRTKYNYKGEYDGTECESVISLVISESYGFADKDKNVSIEPNFMPVSIPYHFTITVEAETPYIITGRTLEELREALECLTISAAYQGIVKRCMKGVPNASVISQIKNGVMGRGENNQPTYNLRVYGHQLQFQTLRNLYEKNFATEITKTGKIIRNVFSKCERTFMTAKAVRVFGYCDIQFMETECLVKKSLKDWAHDEDLPVDLLDDDIFGIRTPKTKLTEEETEAELRKALCINYGMQKFKHRFNTLNNIPFTNTGIVRRELEEIVCADEDWGEDEEKTKGKAYGSRWSRLCARVNRNMTPADYARLRQLFTGGLCFTSRFECFRVLKDIDSYDIRSAYPAVMCHMKFPVTEFEKVPSNQWNKYLNEEDVLAFDRKEAWYGHFVFYNLESKGDINYWPFYKFRPQRTDDDNIRVHDGRLIKCEGAFEVYLTDLDFVMFQKFYKFDRVDTLDMWRSQTSLLPEKLINTILNWFKLKSELPKESREREEVKVKLNSTYGIFVTRLYDDDCVFYEGWRTHYLDGKLFKDKHDRISPLRTIGSYQLGVWVTAWERFILGNLINETTYYGDTDSLFGKFDENRFNEWHKFLNKRRREICKVYESIDADDFGNLGYMEKENHFEEFKMIGQKRYSGSYYEDDVLKIKNTIAGLPKANAEIKIKTPRDLSERLEWDKEESGLLTKAYNDDQPSCKWTDRDGNIYWSKGVKFGAVVHKAPFVMSSTITKIMNTIEFLRSERYCISCAPDPTDALYIKEALDD